MRLTLRTLLAHMDNLLEPADAEAIGQRVEQNEFASTLMHRIREVMRRLRLAAPDIDDRRAGLDPNTVAEYLDNTLPADQVPDFEKVCLDSDLHLAEVASCHQVLSMVLGEPAEVEAGTRQKMYRIPQVAAEQEVAETAASPSESGPGGDHVGRRKHAIPEYLREPPSQRRWQPVLAITLLLVFFAAVVLAALGQFESGVPLARLVGLGPPAEPAVENGIDPAPRTGIEESHAPAAPDETDRPDPYGPNGYEVAPSIPADAPDDPAEETPEAAEEHPVEEAPPPIERPAAGIDRPEQVPPDERAVAPDDMAAPLPPQVVGQFTSQRELLVKADLQSDSWNWVAPGHDLVGTARLLSLPAYRPVVTLASGITLQCIDAAEFTLGPVDAAATTTLRIDYGRLVLRKRGGDAAALRLQALGSAGTLTLEGNEVMAAIEVWYPVMPGGEPPASARLSIHLLAGEARWSEPGEPEPIALSAPAHLVSEGEDTRLEPSSGEAPFWVTGETVSDLDRRSAETLFSLIVPDRSVRLNLREQLTHRLREIRWLALRCLGQLGDFRALVGMLNEVDERLNWDDYLGHMQRSLARGPQAATALREAFVEHYGEENGERMVRWLHGLTAEQLRAGEAETLVEALDHEPLAVRVVSFWCLRELTGMGLFYVPELPALRRRNSVQAWNDRLRAGQIWERAATRGPPGPPSPERHADPFASP